MASFDKEMSTIIGSYDKAIADEKFGSYWAFSEDLQKLEAALREQIQKDSIKDILDILKKLQDGKDITDEDKGCLKIWIVGDADEYVKVENNFGDWKSELERLVGIFKDFKCYNLEISESLKLRALLLDAMRVTGDIVFYLQQKDRVTSFLESTETIDPGERDLLIQIIEGKIRSFNY